LKGGSRSSPVPQVVSAGPHVIAVNLKGPLNLHRAVLPHMIRTKQGKIINIASDAGRIGSRGEAVYSACRGGLISFSKTIARECAT